MSKKAIIGLTVMAIIVTTASFLTYNNNKMNAVNSNKNENTEVNKSVEKSNLSNHDYAKGIIKPMANQPIKNLI